MLLFPWWYPNGYLSVREVDMTFSESNSPEARSAFLKALQASHGEISGFSNVAEYRATVAAASMEDPPLITATNEGGWTARATAAGWVAILRLSGSDLGR